MRRDDRDEPSALVGGAAVGRAPGHRSPAGLSRLTSTYLRVHAEITSHLAAWTSWRRHSCLPRPDSSGRRRLRVRLRVCATSVAEELFLRGSLLLGGSGSRGTRPTTANLLRLRKACGRRHASASWWLRRRR